jgi:hypothetical protein
MECCKCGLQHSMDFRVYKGAIQFRARRKDAVHNTGNKTGHN